MATRNEQIRDATEALVKGFRRDFPNGSVKRAKMRVWTELFIYIPDLTEDEKKMAVGFVPVFFRQS